VPSRRDRLAAGLLGTAFVAFAAAFASQGAIAGWRGLALAAALVAAYGVAQRTVYNAPTGGTVPTEPVLVAMLFTLPLATVPALVLVGLLLGGGWRKVPGGTGHALAVRAAAGWHCAGPVIVLWAAGVRSPGLSHWPVLLAALASQFALDTLVAVVRCTCLGAPLKGLAEALGFTYALDALLAPLAVCIVLSVSNPLLVPLFVLLPVALVGVLAADRNRKFKAAVRLSQALQSERDEARADALTGLANRRAWDEALARARQVNRQGRPGGGAAVVLMADVDHLKLVNDTFGHEAGDDLLRAFAALLARTAPPGALVARLGGDEFGLLFNVPDVAQRGPASLVEELRLAMSGCTIPCGETVSASLGAASCPPASSIQEAVRQADHAAARDKAARRAQRPMVADLRNVAWPGTPGAAPERALPASGAHHNPPQPTRVAQQ